MVEGRRSIEVEYHLPPPAAAATAAASAATAAAQWSSPTIFIFDKSGQEMGLGNTSSFSIEDDGFVRDALLPAPLLPKPTFGPSDSPPNAPAATSSFAPVVYKRCPNRFSLFQFINGQPCVPRRSPQAALVRHVSLRPRKAPLASRHSTCSTQEEQAGAIARSFNHFIYPKNEPGGRHAFSYLQPRHLRLCFQTPGSMR